MEPGFTAVPTSVLTDRLSRSAGALRRLPVGGAADLATAAYVYPSLSRTTLDVRSSTSRGKREC